MAKDILGRELSPGDLVIKSTSGRSSSELLLGVVTSTGKSLMCRVYSNGEARDFRRVTSLNSVFKITNPTHLELKEKADIVDFIET